MKTYEQLAQKHAKQIEQLRKAKADWDAARQEQNSASGQQPTASSRSRREHK